MPAALAGGARVSGAIFYAFLVFSSSIGIVTLGALLLTVVVEGWSAVDAVLLFEPPSSDPAIAGAEPAILATIYLGVLLIALSVPIGVGTAIYLEEYADTHRWYNRLLEVNIQNLAAVPSIVYGILGLAFLVRGLGLGRVLLAGAFILTLLVLPTVIIAAREAIRAVPARSARAPTRLERRSGRSSGDRYCRPRPLGLRPGSILLCREPWEKWLRCCSSERSPMSRSIPRCWATSRRSPCRSISTSHGRRTSSGPLRPPAMIILLVILLTLNSAAIWVRNHYQRKWR